MTLLVAEDDPLTRRALADILTAEGWTVVTAADGNKAWELFAAEAGTGRPFDLICLDIMMPGRSGYDLCRKVREKDAQVPILFISAKAEEVDKVLGLELGADDFIVKPFGAREVVARIRAVVRRFERTAHPTEAKSSQWPFGPWTIDSQTMRASLGAAAGQTVDLTAREVGLLDLLARHQGQVLSRVRILQLLWGWEAAPRTRTLDQHIAVLRKKLGDRDQKLIQTVQGVGYRYEA
jgi:DNA-binding response OmpR family regulator